MLLTVEIQPYCLVKHPKQFLDLRPLQAIKTLILLFHWTLQICVYPVIAALALPRVLPTLVRSRWPHPILTTSHSATYARRQRLRSHFLDYISLSRPGGAEP